MFKHDIIKIHKKVLTCLYEEILMATKKKSKKKTSKKTAKKTANRKARKDRTGKASKKKVAYPPFGDKKNIGNYAKNMILRGESTGTVITNVVKKFPDSKINSVAVSYYRGRLEDEGFDVPAAAAG